MRFCVAMLACSSLLNGVPQVASAASFDCTKASTHVERMICEDPESSELDSAYGVVFAELVGGSSDKEAVRREARSWLKEVRNRCQDTRCLRDAYTDRIAYLQARGADAVDVREPPQPEVTPRVDPSPSPRATATPPASDAAEATVAQTSEPTKATGVPFWVWVVGGFVLLGLLGGASSNGSAGSSPSSNAPSGTSKGASRPRVSFHSEDYVVRGITQTAEGWNVRYSKRANMNVTNLLTVNRNTTGGSIGSDQYSVDWDN